MKAIIMAGGKGTRLAPLTKDIPKPMVKIIDKPVIEHIIMLLKQHKITDIGITLGYKSEVITNYLGDGSAFGVKLTYFVEETPLGTAGSVKATEDFVSQDFLVISGDSYTDINLTRAIEFHYYKQSQFTVIATPHNNPVGLGVLETNHNLLITKFIEKPEVSAPSLINCGMYIINKKILSMVPKNESYDFGKQLLPALVGKLFAYVTYDYWSDIGTLPSYYYTNYLLSQTSLVSKMS